MLNKINNNLIPELLVSPRFRVFRHIILIISILSITINFVWYIPEEIASVQKKALGWFIYSLIFGGEIYLNIYVFIPFLLFRNKFFYYILSVLLMVVFLGISIVLIQWVYLFHIPVPEEISIAMLLLIFISSVIVLGFILAGTTTLLLFKNWINYNQLIDELESATLQSELKLLKNQINPHFLFNMLNNANVLLKKNGEEASRVLFKLENLLRYQLNDSSKEEILLSSDIRFLNDFLNLEKIRRDIFEYNIFKEGDINQIKVSPLLFITFVENAVKHNPDSDNLSYVNLSFKVYDNKLEFICENSKPNREKIATKVGGLGLKNIKRRLELLYANRYQLEIKDEPTKYTVKLELTL